MNKLPVAAGLALALIAGSALAADLPSMKGPPPAYLPPPPVFSWNGLYGGINIGYGFAANNIETGALAVLPPATPNHWSVWSGKQDLNGVIGGGQIGYNWQFSPWLVLGVEADIQAADLNSSRNLLGPMPIANNGAAQFSSINSSSNVDWFGTVRGRIGFVLPSWPNLMLYGTGGFAYGQVNNNVGVAVINPGAGGGIMVGRGNFDGTKTGWTAGGGVEWSPMSFPAWSLKVEYLYTDLGATNIPVAGINVAGAYYACCVFGGSDSLTTRFHTVRAGLNWHFNPFASAPVFAKY